MTDKGDIIKTTDVPVSEPFTCVNDPEEKTLAQYIYKRMSEEQIEFQKDRPKAWPSGLFVTARDIDRYIREYNLHKNNKSSFYDYAEKPKSSETRIDKGFGYNEHDAVMIHDERGIGYYDAPRKVDVYEGDSGAEYVNEHNENKKLRDEALSKSFAAKLVPWDHMSDGTED